MAQGSLIPMIEVVCRGGCEKPARRVPRHLKDPPESFRLVFHNCNDDGVSFHYEDADGNRL